MYWGLNLPQRPVSLTHCKQYTTPGVVQLMLELIVNFSPVWVQVWEVVLHE